MTEEEYQRNLYRAPEGPMPSLPALLATGTWRPMLKLTGYEERWRQRDWRLELFPCP